MTRCWRCSSTSCAASATRWLLALRHRRRAWPSPRRRCSSGWCCRARRRCWWPACSAIQLGMLDLRVMILVAVVCAIAGDSVGYEFGKRFGPRAAAIAAGAVGRRAALVDGRRVHPPPRRQGRPARPAHRPVARADAVDGRHERHAVPDVLRLERDRRRDLGAGLRAARLRVLLRAERGRRDAHLGPAGDPRRWWSSCTSCCTCAVGAGSGARRRRSRRRPPRPPNRADVGSSDLAGQRSQSI